MGIKISLAMKMMPRLMVVWLASVVLVVADDGTRVNVTTGDVVVTATRVAAPMADLPVSVAVLNGPKLKDASLRNPDDLLRSVDGISVVRSYGMAYGIPSQLNIRGVPGQHRSLMMVDGFPLNEASSGFLSMNEVPMAAVERIEVIRGPFSALYGSDALSGVVNLLTPDWGGSPLLETGVTAGNEGYLGGHVTASAGEEGAGWWMCLDGRTIDNYVGRDHVIESWFDPASGRYVSVERPADNYDYEDMRWLAKVGIDLGAETHVVLHARVFDSEMGYGQRDVRPLYPELVDSRSANRTEFGGMTMTSEVSDEWASEFSGFLRWQKRQTWGLNAAGMMGDFPVYVPGYSHNDGFDWQASERVTWTLPGRQVLTGGAEFHRVECDFSATRNEMSGEVLPLSIGRDSEEDNAGFYVQGELPVGRWVRLLATLRADVNSEFGTAVSPRAGVAVLPDSDTTIRASVGRAFRAPSLLERYQPAISFGSLEFRSNPDLDPEHIVSVDAGVERRVTDALKVHVDGFYNEMKDLIYDRLSGMSVTYMNIPDAWSGGMEAGGEWRCCPPVELTASCTLQTSEDDSTGKDLPYTPHTTASLGARFERVVGSWKHAISVTELYTGKRGYVDFLTGMWRPLDPYFRTDVSMRATLHDRCWVAAGAQNILDETYQESSTLNPAPGRLWSVEIGTRF